jgi:hypothetical protein
MDDKSSEALEGREGKVSALMATVMGNKFAGIEDILDLEKKES